MIVTPRIGRPPWLLALALIVAGCATGPTPIPTTAPPTPVTITFPKPAPMSTAEAELTITEPADGFVSTKEAITVRGTAPKGATVTLNNFLGFGEPTTVAVDGTWSMSIALDVGENIISLWLGDDMTTGKQITVTYAP